MPIGLELIARVSERPGRRQRQFQETVKDVSDCNVLMHTAHYRFHDDALYKFTLHSVGCCRTDAEQNERLNNTNGLCLRLQLYETQQQ